MQSKSAPMKSATITMQRKCAKVKAEPKRAVSHTSYDQVSATLPRRCRWSDKLMFYSNHVTHGGPIATFDLFRAEMYLALV